MAPNKKACSSSSLPLLLVGSVDGAIPGGGYILIYMRVRACAACPHARCLPAMLGVRSGGARVCVVATLASKTMGGRAGGHEQCHGTCWRRMAAFV